MEEIFNKVFKNVKRLRQKPVTWKIAAVSLVLKKGERRQREKNRPISLLNIVGKVFANCFYQSLYNHSTDFLTKRQHGFAKINSAETYMLVFLKRNHDALDKELSCLIFAFYPDFSKAFDRVPHLDFLKKLSKIGHGGCNFEMTSDYFEQS